MKRLIEDIICIILLVVCPDWFLEATGMYKSMYAIIKERENNG